MGAVAEEWNVRSERKLDNFLYDFVVCFNFHFNRVHDESGVETNTLAYSLLLLLVLPVMVYLILGSPMVFDYQCP
jgi:ABC-type amino acid transport system permease subunit